MKTNTQDDNQDIPIDHILSGVAGGVVFICLLACIAVIIFKRSVSPDVFVSIVFMLSYFECKNYIETYIYKLVVNFK